MNKQTPKKTAILCISDIYLSRGLQLRAFYEKRGDEVLILTPDWSHRTKQKITDRIEGVRYLYHLPYTKNLSWQRLYGHYSFARACRLELETWKPDRIHALIPANSLAGQMDLYKRRHPEVELYFDLIDLWPESLPIGWFMKTPPAWIWRSMRNRHLDAADLLFAECSLFAERIEEQTGLDPEVLYWTIPDVPTVSHLDLPRDRIALCYLGSVNNIIDLDWMEAFFAELSRVLPIELHLIASGEKKQEMIDRLSAYATIVDHGHVYDDQAKQDIFSTCHYGLNIMKESVTIGLSMKSLDYLKGGLPIINSLHGDLHDWIEDGPCGLNIDRADVAQSVKNLLGIRKRLHLQMREQSRTLYENVLSEQAFEDHLSEAIDSLEQDEAA